MSQEDVSRPASFQSVSGSRAVLWGVVTAVWILVAVVPLQMIYYHHFTYGISRGEGTGFVHNDMPQYTANGREVFERGNGLFYPNPYDDDPDAPVIYFHWLLWLLGFGVIQLGLDPGYLTMALGIVASPFLGWVTLRVVQEVLETDDFRIPLFLLAMWGGGIIALASVAVNVWEGNWWRLNLMTFDPGWNHNWGRNLIYSLEVIYHILVGLCWLAILRQWWKTAFLMGFLVATTHPFTGVQLLAQVSAWWTILCLFRPNGFHARQWLAWSGLSAIFLFYNLVFLNFFPQHQVIHEILTIPHLLTHRDILLAYGPIGLLAAVRLWQDRRRLGWREGFLVVSFAVSFLLATHDRFLPIDPIEPKHFTRGYVWMPLFLLAAPLLQRWLVAVRDRLVSSGRLVVSDLAIRERLAAAALPVLVAPIFVVAVFDNMAYNFLLFERWNQVHHGCFLMPDSRAALEWMEDQQLDGVLLCPGEEIEWYRAHRMTSYLSASYTGLRPYIGHHLMTPDIEQRLQQVQDWTLGRGVHPWMSRIDYILVDKRLAMPLLERAGWRTIYENESLELLERRTEF